MRFEVVNGRICVEVVNGRICVTRLTAQAYGSTVPVVICILYVATVKRCHIEVVSHVGWIFCNQ